MACSSCSPRGGFNIDIWHKSSIVFTQRFKMSKNKKRPIKSKSSKSRQSVFSSKLNMLIVVLAVAAVGTWLLSLSFAATPPSFPPKTTRALEHVPDEILLKFKPGTSTTTQTKVLKDNNLTPKEEIPHIGVKRLKVPAEALDAVVIALAHNPAVEFAEPNFIAHALTTTPNDPLYSKQWGIPKTQANTAWDTTTGSSTVVIGEVDTGVKSSYPDLSGKVLPGYDYANNDSNPDDDNGHGTAVARTMVALTNNGTEIAGYCWNCKVLPVKALNSSGSGSYSAITNAITYATDHGAKIINMSLGGSSSSSTLDSALQYAHNKGVVLIAAAGNNGTSAVSYPANSPGVISVAASASTDKLYSFSEFGTWVDIAAPGCSGTSWITYYNNTVQTDFCGTSQASPVVSGIAGLLVSKNGTASNTQVEQALLQYADSCCSGSIGGGRVNAYKALTGIGGVTQPTGTVPVVTISSPTNGTTIRGNNVTITAAATDDGTVVKMEVYIDGQLKTTSSSSSISYRWSTNKIAPGLHSIVVIAYDNTGNNAQAAVTVLK